MDRVLSAVWGLEFATAGELDALSRRGANFVRPSGDDWCRGAIRSSVIMRCPQIDIDTAQVTRQLFPPRMEKLSTSMDFYAANFTAALTGGVGDEVEICSFQVLDGMVGYVQQMNIYVLQPTPAARVAFALRVGNSPVSGFSEIQNPPCAAAMTYVPRNNLQIRAGLGQRISLIGRNLGGGALTIGGEIAGWIHPETAEALAWGLSL